MEIDNLGQYPKRPGNSRAEWVSQTGRYWPRKSGCSNLGRRGKTEKSGWRDLSHITIPNRSEGACYPSRRKNRRSPPRRSPMLHLENKYRVVCLAIIGQTWGGHTESPFALHLPNRRNRRDGKEEKE